MTEFDAQALEMIKEIANEDYAREPGRSLEKYNNQDVLRILKAYIKWYELMRIARETNNED